MATYILRDEKGVAKAKMTGDAANSVFRNLAGHFRETSFTNGKKKTVFQIDEDSVLELKHLGLTIYFWKGDTLVPQD